MLAFQKTVFLLLITALIWFYLLNSKRLKLPRVRIRFRARNNNTSTHLKLQEKVSKDTTGTAGFLEVMDGINGFPWEEYQIAINATDYTKIWRETSDLINRLVPFLAMEPKAPINTNCTPPPLKPISELNCRKGKRTKKVGLLLQFGFDVDVLEIHLNELFSIVDHFFLIECTWAHSATSPKPLMWELVKGQPRFRKFTHKITHFVVDDASTIHVRSRVNGTPSKMITFEMEKLQERMRWKKFIEWNTYTKMFNDTDIIGFGDTDEIASRESINYLKHCELDSDPIDVAIWFPFGSIDQAFLSDFPVYEHAFTLGDPTFWSLSAASNKSITYYFQMSPYPSRNRGKSDNFVLGGMHMSHYGYLPYQLIKRLTPSEGSLDFLTQVSKFQSLLRRFNNSLPKLERFYTEDILKPLKYRIFKLSKISQIEPQKDEIAVLPWFYNCNRERYPAWEKKHDSRLD